MLLAIMLLWPGRELWVHGWNLIISRDPEVELDPLHKWNGEVASAGV